MFFFQLLSGQLLEIPMLLPTQGFYHQQSTPSQAAVFPFPREKTRPSNVENPAASVDGLFCLVGISPWKNYRYIPEV